MFFGLGSFLAARQAAENENEQIAALRAELGSLKRQRAAEISGTSGKTAEAHAPAAAPMDDHSRAALVADIKKQLRSEMGLLPVSMLRERRASFVEMYSYDSTGASNYGTAGYLGNGYFITVKHGVVALGDGAASRRISSIKLMYDGRGLQARIVDTGDANVEVDPGDWAILKVKEPVDLPALDLDLTYTFDFADPIFRLGNDYSKGIILSTGYVGQRTANNLVTCLTDGHPGVSGGGVLNGEGHLVGIPIGRMQGDYRFSFILPLRAEMFRKVPQSATLAQP
ncbi:MAG: trypsin-like peptidase domain-containing protein [Mesorhizobium sp.]|nr:trypsin-like peptidase domain-containing protein [Mesorhizobium sp.]